MKATTTKRMSTAHRARRRPPHPRDTARTGLVEMSLGPAFTALLTGGDVDADFARAWDSGDEAVGGTTATPDQDVVDEIGRALGVEQDADAEVWTSLEILDERDRHRWEQED
jgi:hypothetical protein